MDNFGVCTIVQGSCMSVYGPWIRLIHNPYPPWNLDISWIVPDMYKAKIQLYIFMHDNTFYIQTQFIISYFFTWNTLHMLIHQTPLLMYHVPTDHECVKQPLFIHAFYAYQGASLYFGFEVVVFIFYTIKDKRSLQM